MFSSLVVNIIHRNIGKLFIIVAIVAMPGQYQVVLQGVAWLQMARDRPSNESLFETLSASVCGQRVCDSCERIGSLEDSGDSGIQMPTVNLKWKIAERMPIILITAPSPRGFCSDYQFTISDFRSPPPTAPPQRA